MKKLFLSAISIALAASVYAIPHTFKEGDVLSAEKMNENFQALVNSNVLRSKSVNCEDGETINGAIENGYNDITVSGTCNENLLYTVWRDSGVDNKPSGMPVPRYLKITGADSTAKIVDTTSNTENTISVNSGATVVLENITISGGKFGVAATRNSNLLMTGGVTIEGFTENGIRVDDSSYLGINDGGVTITGGTGAVRGIYIGTSSSGWVASATMTGVERGFDLFANATVVSGGYSISASKRGIRMNNGHFFQYGGAGVIESTSEYAVDAYQSTFDIWNPSTLEVKNLVGGQGISLNQSRSSLNNLKMPDFDNSGSGWNPAINVQRNSNLVLENAVISASTDVALVSISAGSVTEIRDSTLTVGNAGAGIEAIGSSGLRFRNSTISGTVGGELVNIAEGSSAEIQDQSTLTITSGGQGLRVAGSSRLKFRNSTISGSVTDNLVSVSEGSSAQIEDSSTLTITSGGQGLRVADSSQLIFKDSTISGTVTDGSLASVNAGSSAEVRDATLTLDSGTRALGVSRSSDLEIRNSKISGTATDELIRVTRGSNAIISNETTLSQTSSDTPDVSVSNLSMLSIWNEEASINKVDCYSKGYVSANEGIVTTLSESCTE